MATIETQAKQFHFMMAHKYSDRNSNHQDFEKAKAHAEVAISLYNHDWVKKDNQFYVWDNDVYKAICEDYNIEPYQIFDDEQLKQIEKLTGKDK